MSGKRITRNALMGVIQVAVSSAILFWLYRYLLQTIGTEQLGVWSVVLASTSVGRLSDMGFSGAVLRFVAQRWASGDEQGASRVVQTAVLSIGALLTILVLAVYPSLTHLLAWSIPAKALPQAMAILPWAVLSLWFGMLAGIFQSALDGCQRMDLRNALLIACNFLYISAILWLVPRHGLVGLAIGQMAQSVMLLLLSWLALRRQIRVLPWVPWKWSKETFSEIFSYAMNFQLSSLVALLFDPITKFLMSRYGGLSDAAYLQMASQVLIKAKAILVSALQAVLPEIAGTKDSDHSRLNDIYRGSYRVLFFMAWPYYLAFALALPLISILWIGHVESTFVVFGQILAIGGALSIVGLPAYFLNIGTGKLFWNTATHAAMGIINLMLGWALGTKYGGIGVLVAAVSSLTLAHWILVIIVQRRIQISLYEIMPEALRVMFLWVLFGSIGGCGIYFETRKFASDGLSSLLSLLFYLTVMAIVMWRHSYRLELQKKIFPRSLGTAAS